MKGMIIIVEEIMMIDMAIVIVEDIHHQHHLEIDILIGKIDIEVK
jgi:hypothetical protein